MNRRGAIALVATLLVASSVYLLGWSSFFTVKSLSITGAPTQQSQQLITSLVGDITGKKLARIEPRRTKSAIEDIDWVESARIRRNWLTRKVTVTITPRTPIAIFGGRSLDKSGTLFQLPGGVSSGLPVVSAQSPQVGVEAINLFTSLPSEFTTKVQSLQARNQSSYIFTVVEGGRTLTVSWGSQSDSDLKVKVYRALISRPENKTITHMDLSAPHAPIVK